jgi:hypothetical protein
MRPRCAACKAEANWTNWANADRRSGGRSQAVRSKLVCLKLGRAKTLHRSGPHQAWLAGPACC